MELVDVFAAFRAVLGNAALQAEGTSAVGTPDGDETINHAAQKQGSAYPDQQMGFQRLAEPTADYNDGSTAQEQSGMNF